MKKYPLINIGFGNVVAKHRIVAVLTPDSAPMKRLRDLANERLKLIDASQGRRIRAIIITDSDHVILSAISLETIVQRLRADDDAPTSLVIPEGS